MNECYLVTGAGGGMGHEIAKQLLDKDNFVVVSDLYEDVLKSMYSEYERCVIIPQNLMDVNSAKEIVSAATKRCGKIKGFVHCAGFDKMAAITQNKYDDIIGLMTIHAIIPILICGQIAKKINHADSCSIVLISSVSAHEGAAGHTAYAAAKGAIEGFLKPAAAELADKGIRINVIAPGVVQTNMSKGWIEKLDDNQRKRLNAQYPFGLGKPEYIRDLIDFLLSDKSKWITGQTIIIDGGRLCK